MVVKFLVMFWGGNSLIAKDGSFLENLTVRITGSNNKIIIGENVRIHSNCSILIFGNNSKMWRERYSYKDRQ